MWLEVNATGIAMDEQKVALAVVVPTVCPPLYPVFWNDPGAGELLPLAEVERRYVLRVLEQAGGNKVKAAKILGINRATVYRILNEQDPGE